MNDYKAVPSSLDISKRIAFYLEMSDIANLRFSNPAGTVRMINDILQGRSDTSVEDMLSDLEQKDNGYYAKEIAAVRQDVQDFLHQKQLRSLVYDKSSGVTYKYKLYEGNRGNPLKIITQHIFDKMAKTGFPPDFFRESYFDQVTIYCLPKHADFFRSVFQNCKFAVCRISGAIFDGASIYGSEFHSVLMEHTTFFRASLDNTHFHDSSLTRVSFQNARLKLCNTIDCTLDSINYLNAVLDGCTYGRVIPSAIRNLETAMITQGGATDEECRQNRNAVFRALGAEQEAA